MLHKVCIRHPLPDWESAAGVLIADKPDLQSAPSCAPCSGSWSCSLVPDARHLVDELQQQTGEGFQRLNDVVAQMLDDWSMISFHTS